MEENKQSVVETVSGDLLKEIFAATEQVEKPLEEKKPLTEPAKEEIKEIEEKKDEVVGDIIDAELDSL